MFAFAAKTEENFPGFVQNLLLFWIVFGETYEINICL